MTTEISSAAVQAAAPRGRNIVTVASGKGGVGKTWLSVTLTHALARMNRKTLLFDGDLGLANLDIQLGLMPKQDLSAVIAGRLTLNQAIVDYDDGGFHVIAGRSGSGSLANIASSRLQMLGEDLALLVVWVGAGDKVGLRRFEVARGMAVGQEDRAALFHFVVEGAAHAAEADDCGAVRAHDADLLEWVRQEYRTEKRGSQAG